MGIGDISAKGEELLEKFRQKYGEQASAESEAENPGPPVKPVDGPSGDEGPEPPASG